MEEMFCRAHRASVQPAVYQVTRQGHLHCDVTDGMLLDITPLDENGAKLFTLYDKDLTEGVNLLIGKMSITSCFLKLVGIFRKAI